MGLLVRAFVLAVATVLMSPAAFALGLGEVKLNSHLNQPLDAEIQLLQTRDLTENEILVDMATREDFERVGVDKTFFLTGVKFTVDMNNAAGPIVRLSTQKPVREPFLNFIVQAQWPSGKLLREYTVLMDLPVFTEEKAAPVQAARRSQPEPRQTTQSQRQAPPPQAERPYTYKPQNTSRPDTTQRVSSSAEGNVFGPVSSSDTLWTIASQNRPSEEVSVHQTMLAIQRLNPNAFINNNINLLKRGQILRLPSVDDVRNVSSRQAVSEVVAQNRRWRNNDDVSDAPLEGSKNLAPSQTSSSDVEGRLKLSSVGSRDSSLEGRGSGGDEGSTEALENELAGAKEELSASKRENEDLRSRIASMEEQIQTMQKLLEVSNEEIRAFELAMQKNAELQKQMEAAKDELQAGSDIDATDLDLSSAEGEVSNVETPVTDDAEITSDDLSNITDESDAAGEVDSSSTEVVASETTETAEPEIVEAPVETAPVEEPVNLIAPPATKKPSIMDLLMENLLYVAGGLALLIGILVYFLMTRNHGFDDDDYELEESVAVGQDEFDDDRTDTVIGSLKDLDSSDDSFADSDGEDKTEIPVQPETDDVAAECDIHIAYSDYETAERLLTNALANDPNNTTNHLKLLEVYSRQNDVARFDPEFARLHGYADDESISRGAQLRSYIDDAPEFDLSAHEPAAAPASDEEAGMGDIGSEDDTLEFDIDEQAIADGEDNELTLDDLSAELSSGSDLGEDIQSSTNLSDDDFDLALDEDLSLGDVSDETFNLDLDISDDSEEELNLDLDGDASDSLTEEEAEFDLGLDDAVLGLDLEGASQDVVADSDDLGDEIDIDFDSLDVESADGEEALVDDDDISAADFDISGEDLGSDGDLDIGIADESTDDLDFDLDSSSDVEAGALDLDTEVASGGEDADIDLDDLDKDLDMLASGFEGDLADLDEQDSPEDSDNDLDLGENTLVMEEPVTDFDSFDLEEGTDASFEEIEEEEAPIDLDALVDLEEESPELDGSGLDSSELDSSELEADAADAGFDLDSLDADIEGISDDSLVTDDADDLVIPDQEASDSSEDLGDLSIGEDDLTADLDDLSLSPGTDVEPEAAPALEADEGSEEESFEFDAESLDAEAKEGELSADDFDLPDFDPETDNDSDLGFLSDRDELSTKLDLLRVFVDMGDADSAMHTYEEIIEEGNDEQKKEAKALVEQLD